MKDDILKNFKSILLHYIEISRAFVQKRVGQISDTVTITVSDETFAGICLAVLFAGAFLTQGAGNVGTILCLLALIWQFLLGKLEIIGKKEKRLLLIFSLWAVAVLFSTFYSFEPLRGISKWANLYVWCVLPLALLMVLKRSEKWNKIALFAGITALTILCGLLAYQGIVFHQRAGRIVDFNEASMGLILSVALPSVFVCFLDERIFGKYRWTVLPLFVLCNIGLLYNQTRGAWITCGSLYLVATIVYFRRNIEITTFVLVMGLVFGSFVCTNKYINQRWTLDPSHSSNASRVRLWTSAYHIWKDHPILGAGYRNFGKLYQTKYVLPRASSEERKLTHAHNDYLMVLAQQGIVGEIFFLFCYGSFLVYGLRGYRKYRDPYSLMMILMVTGMMVHGVTDCHLLHPFFTRVHWTMLGWAAYTHAKLKER